MGKILAATSCVGLALLGKTYLPTWYELTPGGKMGANNLDMTRAELLRRHDEIYYLNASTWGSAQPSHDDDNNKNAQERYFTLITDFFEYGWGDAFHMAPLKPGWSFLRSMAEVEKHFSMLINLKPGSRVADLGMGIGGPARRIVEFTGAFIDGLTNVKYQLNRAAKITSSLPAWNQERLKYHEGDYNKLPPAFKSDTYDAVYFMESLSHAEDRTPPLSEARRIVKPGNLVGAWQWMLKPAFNYSDSMHMDLKRGMEYGGGLRNLNKPDARIKEWNDAGLEVLISYDMGDDFLKRGWVGWWVAVTTGHDLPSMLTSSYYGRRLTMATVKVLEIIGIAEPGTYRTAVMLEHCGWGSATAGEMGIFTPAWVMVGIKPPNGQPVKQGPIADGPEKLAEILAGYK
jgi:sterol 24-C-methyltransferase